MEPRTVHLGSVESSFLSDKHQAKCSCGWEARPTRVFDLAVRQAKGHQIGEAVLNGEGES